MSSFWVVERFEHGKSAGYWDGGSSRSFVPEIDKAVQFVRKQDAFWATKGWHWNDTKITEHIMIGALEKTAEPTADPLPHSVITQTDSLHQCRTCGTYFRAEQVEREKAEREQRAEETVRNAAPDLLSACEHSLRNVESMLHMLPLKADATERLSLEAWGHILRAAIARATGGAS